LVVGVKESEEQRGVVLHAGDWDAGEVDESTEQIVNTHDESTELIIIVLII
jgi:hypothetical protein